MTMSANDRLKTAQSALEQRGVVDVKFCFALGLDSRPKSAVTNGVADFLDAYLAGRYTVLDKIGDAPQPQKE
jgi:hypothetical protein